MAPAFARSDRPRIPCGVASGDVMGDRALVWSRCDRRARMVVEYAATDSFTGARRIAGPVALEETDFTTRVELTGLAPGQEMFYRVSFRDLADGRAVSEPVEGRFRTAPAAGRDVVFQWSADTAGQGWGINEDWGGMKIYRTMRRADPDFFIHCGDAVYADAPIEARVPLADGTVWKNVTTEAKSKVAETLPEFRGNYLYNLIDQNLREFNKAVPVIALWDDHETRDNWYPGELLYGDGRYAVKSASVLSSRARRAFLEYNPVRPDLEDPGRIHRTVNYGPSLDVFCIDMRSYRGPNGANDENSMSGRTDLLGRPQLDWLKAALRASDATWKVIAAGQPLGLIIYDDWRTRNSFDGLANGDGPARGRELESAELLTFIKRQGISNVVWLTADVHYTAAHYYDPEKARYQDFHPFWEFVSGPLNAGTFGPNKLDDTFGPRVVYQKAPEPGHSNLPPSAGLQFFGEVRIDGRSEVMTVALKDLAGTTLYSTDLEPGR